MNQVDELRQIVRTAKIGLSDMPPAEWAEAHRFLTSDITPRPGPFSYDYTPYLREVINCLSPYHDASIISVMKGAQIGFSTGVIESGIGYIISESPGPILFMTGHADLTDDAMNLKIDQTIESCGLRDLIRPAVIKKKNQRTGDTSKRKEFPGGSLRAFTASHKVIRQFSVQYGFLDDFEAFKNSTEQSGDTWSLLRMRFTAYSNKMKVFKISTPERKETSNIEPAFQEGDQRRYHVPCPCCGQQIVLYWSVEMTNPRTKTDRGGITWKLDEQGRVVPGSVGYICQECGDFFDESHKQEMMAVGEWIPTAQPKQVGNYSYHISSLYAPPGQYTWEDYVYQYLEANPPGGERKEKKHQTFINTVLGETYSVTGSAPEAKTIMTNIRQYRIGMVPEWQSTKDGNGSIVMLTCACDLNGIEKDARLDYEIVAWSETGSSYSVRHGSIGTFIPREGLIKEENRVDRERWTYEHKKPNSVWPELEKILQGSFETDTGRKMKILLTGVDTGHYTQHAYAFVEKKRPQKVIGLKGDKEGKYRRAGMDAPMFKQSRERTDLFLVDVNHVKDEVAELMELEWSKQQPQPPGFMNYPSPAGKLYSYPDFFAHYEAENRVDDFKEGELVGQKWVKKSTAMPNHYWDVYVYNYALKDIWAMMVLKESPHKKGNWADFVKWILKR